VQYRGTQVQEKYRVVQGYRCTGVVQGYTGTGKVQVYRGTSIISSVVQWVHDQFSGTGVHM
jgi:hypothetical protein